MFQSMFGSSSGSTGGKDPWSPTEAPAAGTRAAGAAADGSNAAAGGGSAQGLAQGGQQGGITRDSLDGGGQQAALAIRDAPGAGLVMWAESAAGSMELERPYAHSTSLDGEYGVLRVGTRVSRRFKNQSCLCMISVLAFKLIYQLLLSKLLQPLLTQSCWPVLLLLVLCR
jgi:hypothetical protein